MTHNSGHSADIEVVDFDRILATATNWINHSIKSGDDNLRVNNSILPMPRVCTEPALKISQFQPFGYLVSDVESNTLTLGSAPSGDMYKSQYVTSDTFSKYLQSTIGVNCDLVLSPEYSIPLDVIAHFILTKQESLPHGTLYVLGCEGVGYERFNNFIEMLERLGVFVYRQALSNNHGIISAVFYITRLEFKLSDGNSKSQIIAFPQLKTIEMLGESIEKGNLNRGQIVYSVGTPGKSFRTLVTLICSDVRNYKALESISSHCGASQRLLIFNPQLNSKGRHGFFKSMQSRFIEELDSTFHKNVKIISLNWSSRTRINDSIHIDKPWSAILEKRISKVAELNEFVKRSKSFISKGVELACSDSIVMWLFHPYSHTIRFALTDGTAGEVGLAEISERKYNLGGEMTDTNCRCPVPSLIKECKAFEGFCECDDNNSSCDISGIDNWIRSVYYREQRVSLNDETFSQLGLKDIYELHDDEVPRITSKYHGGEYSKDMLYTALRINRRLQGHDARVVYNAKDIKMQNMIGSLPPICYNVELSQAVHGEKINHEAVVLPPQYIRVAYIKNSNETHASNLYNQLMADLKKENQDDKVAIVVYYSDTFGDFTEENGSEVYYAGLRRFPTEQRALVHGISLNGPFATHANQNASTNIATPPSRDRNRNNTSQKER